MRVTGLFLASLLLAQATRDVTGSITDLNGAAIPGAKVTASPSGQTAATDAGGSYRLNLAPGTYAISIEAQGFRPLEAQVVVPTDRSRYFDAVLQPALLANDFGAVTVTDSASSRPGYLQASELAQGSIFTAYGKFPEGGQFRAQIGDGSSVRDLPLFYKSPGLIAGYIPSETAVGGAFLDLIAEGGPGKRSPIRIVDSRPTFFTLDQSGAGAGVFTDDSGDVITRENPARPGGIYTAWITNAGAADNDLAPRVRDRRFFFQASDFRMKNNSVANEDVLYFGPSGIRGLDQLNFRLKPDITLAGCGIPVQLGVKATAGQPYSWGNEVTIPIARSGVCGDRFGFAAEDRVSLTGAGIGTMEVAIGETTFVSSNVPQRHVTSGRLTGNLWTDSVYRPVPDESCELRWQPPSAISAGPRALTFAGTATMTVPWGQFALSPTSNAGPYTLTFGLSPNFTTGNYSMNFGQGFTVGGQAFNLQLGGPYQRPAGQAREFLAGRFATVPPEQGFQDWVRSLFGAVNDMPGTLRSQLNTDFNIQINHGTLGTHSIRCIGDSAGGHAFINRALESYVPLLPPTANTSTASLRFFPKDRLRFAGTGPVNRIQVTFDSSLVFSDIGLRYR